jgi:ubiquinone/menaquinone biosynthesis C-methylase UbiE
MIDIKTSFNKIRANRIANIVCPLLSNGESVLDLGCGDLLVADSIQRKKSVKITGIDVINTNLTELPLKIYNGRRIPFEDKSFDKTYVSFVFHHTDGIESLLKECIRVTRKRVVILEDVYENKVDLLITKILDYTNKFSASRYMKIPFNFKTEKEWMKLFSKLKVKDVKSQQIYPDFLKFTKHRLFVFDLE